MSELTAYARPRPICRWKLEFYPALEERIRGAKHHIHVEFYIWQGDETGVRFLRLLTEAAQRGVVVRLLLDGVGSHGFAENLLTDFRTAGGHFSWFQSLDPKRQRFFSTSATTASFRSSTEPSRLSAA